MLTAEPTPEELGVTFGREGAVESGFIIGTTNDEAAIMRIFTINGHSMEELDRVLSHVNRGSPFTRRSHAFLLPGETLVSHMLDARDSVSVHGLTHQDLAIPMKYILELNRAQYVGSKADITYRGIPLHVRVTHYRGGWLTPFDSRNAHTEIAVVNKKNRRGCVYCNLTPETVWRYGIYYGIEIPSGISYPVDPEDIISVFGLDQKLLK
jgi:hypothetical protein